MSTEQDKMVLISRTLSAAMLLLCLAIGSTAAAQDNVTTASKTIEDACHAAAHNYVTTPGEVGINVAGQSASGTYMFQSTPFLMRDDKLCAVTFDILLMTGSCDDSGVLGGDWFIELEVLHKDGLRAPFKMNDAFVLRKKDGTTFSMFETGLIAPLFRQTYDDDGNVWSCASFQFDYNKITGFIGPDISMCSFTQGYDAELGDNNTIIVSKINTDTFSLPFVNGMLAILKAVQTMQDRTEE